MKYSSESDLSTYRLDARSRSILSIAARLIDSTSRNSGFKSVTLYRGDYDHIDRSLRKATNNRYTLDQVTFRGYPVKKAAV